MEWKYDKKNFVKSNIISRYRTKHILPVYERGNIVAFVDRIKYALLLVSNLFTSYDDPYIGVYYILYTGMNENKP